jgi:NADH-quinone oxidoreductase subunit C
MITSKDIEQAITARFTEGLEPGGEVSGAPVLFVSAEKIVEVCEFLKSEPGLEFNYLASLTAVDRPEGFEVVYHLYSISEKAYATLKVKTCKDVPCVPSVTSVWLAADWQEREVYDMFGIDFPGHPDLRRILMDEEWQGHPLRKDYVEE